MEEVLQVQRGLRDVGGVLEQSDVARHERGGGEAHDLPEREVPRHHGEDDAERPVADQRAGGARVVDVVGVRVLVREQPLGAGGVPAHRLGALGRLRAGRRDGLAHLDGHGAGDGDAVLVEEVGGPVQPGRALFEGGGAVLAEGLRGGGDPAFGLVVAEGVERPDQFAVRGVDRRDGHGSGLLASVLRPCRAAPVCATRPVPPPHVPGLGADHACRGRPACAAGAFGARSAKPRWWRAVPPGGQTSAASGSSRAVRTPGSGAYGSSPAVRGASA